MSEWQKIIKYLAIAFGIYLTITIIGFIVGIIGMIGTGIFASEMISNIGSETIDFSKSYTKIENLDIDVTNCEFYIMQGSEFKVEATDVAETCKIELDNTTLKIKENKMKIFKSTSPKIIVYIPNGVTLNMVKVNLGVSNSNIKDLTCDELKMDIGAGNLNMQNVNSNKTDLDCGAGNVEIKDSNMGNLDLDCGVGKFDFKGIIKGDSYIDCGVGNVNIDLLGGSDIYKLVTENGIGEIRVNGSKLSGKQTTGSGENRIDISGGIGSIEVEIEESK